MGILASLAGWEQNVLGEEQKSKNKPSKKLCYSIVKKFSRI